MPEFFHGTTEMGMENHGLEISYACAHVLWIATLTSLYDAQKHTYTHIYTCAHKYKYINEGTWYFADALDDLKHVMIRYPRIMRGAVA